MGGSVAPAPQGPSLPGTLESGPSFETRFPATFLLISFVGFVHHGQVLPAWPLHLCPKGVRLDSAAAPGPPGMETQRKVGSLRGVTSPLLLARCLQRPAGMEGAQCSCHWHMCLRSFHIHSTILQIRATEAQGVKWPAQSHLAGTQPTRDTDLVPEALDLGLLASARLQLSWAHRRQSSVYRRTGQIRPGDGPGTQNCLSGDSFVPAGNCTLAAVPLAAAVSLYWAPCRTPE